MNDEYNKALEAHRAETMFLCVLTIAGMVLGLLAGGLVLLLEAIL